MEAYSDADVSWTAKELTEDRGDLFTPAAPLPLPVIVPLMVPFPLPFPLTPWEREETKQSVLQEHVIMSPLILKSPITKVENLLVQRALND